MSTSRQRRLGGLAPVDRRATVPPSAAPAGRLLDQPADEEAPGPAAEQVSSPPSRRRRPGMHRKAVTVPAPLVERLRQRAGELDRFHTDLVLDCLAATAAAFEREHAADPPGDTPFHRPRRRANRGRTVTTLTLYLTRDEVDGMDTLARRLGLSRSAVVAAALDRALEQLS